MSSCRALLSLLLVVSAAPLAVPAGEPAPVAAKPASNCRCCSLDRVYAPYLKKLPAPEPGRKVGTSHLAITTSSPEAQAWFDRGLNLLHCFWEFEAYRCFLQAVEADPQCAMAYWGVCMALPGTRPEANSERAAAFEQAKLLAPGATAHEQLYIETLRQILLGGTSSAVPVLRRILAAHPDDADAAAFLVLWLRDGYAPEGKPNPGTREAIALAEAHLARHPKHVGLHHYRVHVLEAGPDFEHARRSANILPSLAPGSGHIVHMPGHIYFLAGEFEKACTAFRACRKVEETYLQEEKIPPFDSQNNLHNLHYLAFAAANAGRYEEALEVATAFADIEIPADRRWSAGAGQVYYLGASAPAMVHMRFHAYEAAAATLDPGAVPANCEARHFLTFLKGYCEMKHQLLAGTPAAELADLRFRLESAAQRLLSGEPRGTSSAELAPWRLAAGTTRMLLAELRVWTKAADAPPETLRVWIDSALREQARGGYMEPPYT
ncbi:MAG: hypothetical protein HKO57_00510, partial [Akkermansiaceae bacterium]|nr:hypothetical protein [Akkermansiaceae bacterium]